MSENTLFVRYANPNQKPAANEITLTVPFNRNQHVCNSISLARFAMQHPETEFVLAEELSRYYRGGEEPVVCEETWFACFIPSNIRCPQEWTLSHPDAFIPAIEHDRMRGELFSRVSLEPMPLFG